MNNHLYLTLCELDPTCEYPYVIITDSYLWDTLRHHMENNIEEYGQREIDYYLNVAFPTITGITTGIKRIYSGLSEELHDHLVEQFDSLPNLSKIMNIIAFKKSESAVLFKLKDLS